MKYVVVYRDGTTLECESREDAEFYYSQEGKGAIRIDEIAS